MKKILLASLVAISLLLPAFSFAGNNAQARTTRHLDHVIADWVLLVTSDAVTGPVEKIKIFNMYTGEIAIIQQCGGYECGVSLEDLSGGAYVAVVACQNETVTIQFKI